MQTRADAAEVQARIERMSHNSRMLCVLFKIVFGASIVAAVLFFSISVANGLGSGRRLSSILLPLLPFIFSAAVGCVLLYVAVAIFRDVSKAKSPFSLAQARRIAILGVLFLFYAALETLVSLNPLHVEFGDVGVDYISSPGVFLDIKLLIAAIVCFCLSYVFRYGALLQWFQDETL